MIKVILVDDEDIERDAMAEIIPWEKLDMELVDTAWNGIEGLEKIRMHVPDIVITDIKMPVMDGIQLIRNTKELYPDILLWYFPDMENMSIQAEPWSWESGIIF